MKGRVPLERAISIWSRGITWIYTLLMSWRFRSWGKDSRVSPPMIVSCPWAVEVGTGVVISEHVWLNAKEGRLNGRSSLIIGNGTYIGRFVHINACQDVVIEANVLIADLVYISDEEHDFKDPNIPIKLQGSGFKGPVLLRSGCWIGAGVAILPGVVVGKNAVVGANAVVTRDVSDYTVVAGVPAREIKRIN